MIKSKNVFYVSNFNVIGGVETYIFELARKYNDYDITVIYRTGSLEQIKRLRKYVRVIKYKGEQIKCDKAFFNYETDIIDNIEAKEYIQLIHAMFKTQGNLTAQVNPKITKYLGVSEGACREWKELTGNDITLCRNPLQITEEEKKPILYLISATRLTAEKGKERMIRLAEELDKAGINYLWLVFTNDVDAIDNPNVVYMKPRLNIRPYIASIKGKGYGVQLSNSEGDCYFTRECEGLGVPLVVTPVPSFNEQGLVEGKNCYYMPFDMVDVRVERLLNIPTYDPYVAEDGWLNNLVKSKSTYKEELNMEYKVEALSTYEDFGVTDSGLGYIPKAGETFTVSKERLDILLGENDGERVYVKVIEEIKPTVEEKEETTPVEEPKKKPAKKKKGGK